MAVRTIYIFLLTFVLFGLEVVDSVQEHSFHFSRFSDVLPKIPDRQNPRPELPQVIGLHLYEGDILILNLCTNSSTNITFTNLTFSNDGAVDNISLYVDSYNVGYALTPFHSDWGRLWDNFFGSGYIGQSVSMVSGKHSLIIKILSSGDCYGVELGTLSFTTSENVDKTALWCGLEHVMEKSKCLPRSGDTVVPLQTGFAGPSFSPQNPPRFIHVQQFSKRSDCIDKPNVKISFTSSSLLGTQITVKHEENLSGQTSNVAGQGTFSRGRQCKASLWQLGQVDGSNNDFENIYPGKTFALNISSLADPSKRFPAKILPFVTKEITLYFEVPGHLNIKQGSVLFVLGLVNLTKESKVGLQVYNHNTASFSETLYLTFTPTYQVMGWHLPNIGPSSRNTSHIIKLHFISDANVILFDFLKLDFSRREERKQNQLIAKRGNLKIRGLRYENSLGITVVVDNTEIAYNIEDVVVFFKKFSRYEVILRIHYSGVIYPYKAYYLRRTSNGQQMVDVSGFLVKKGSPEPWNDESMTNSNNITSIYVDTPTDIITINYKDGTIVQLQVNATVESTQLKILGIHDFSNAEMQTLYFLSTHVNDQVAAVNNITMDAVKAHIMSDLGKINGGYNYTIIRSSDSSVFYANNVFNLDFTK